MTRFIIIERADGFSLIAVLIGISLASAVAVGLVSALHYMQNQTLVVSALAGKTALVEDLNAALQSQSVCPTLLSGAKLNKPVSMTWPLAAGAGPNVTGTGTKVALKLAANRDVPGYFMHIKSLSTQNSVFLGSLSSSVNLYETDLQAELTSTLTGFSYQPTTVSHLYFEMKNGQMTNCFGPSEFLKVATDLCLASGATYTNGVCYLAPKLPTVNCGNADYMQGFNNDKADCQTLAGALAQGG